MDGRLPFGRPSGEERGMADKRQRPSAGKTAPTDSDTSGPKLLSGGNPQIPKGDGDGPVQAYIAAMPGWKSAIGRRLDALVVETVPDVVKAVKWNTPFYGVKGQGWFLAFRCYTRYVQVSFLNGASLQPPPKPSKHARVRYWDIHEEDGIDERQFVDWVRQASALPGERL